jgi:phage terminase Nu1 subunit (DNA packaging protein)
MTDVVNQLELAALLGRDPGTIRAWQRAGMPVVQRSKARGNPNLYSVPDVVKWLRERAVAEVTNAATTVEAARRRKLAAEAQLAEHRLEETRARYVDRGLAREIVAEEFAVVRARCLRIGANIAAALAAEPDAATCERIIQAEITAALTELSADGGGHGDGRATG